jgi:hypothetical protein
LRESRGYGSGKAITLLLEPTVRDGRVIVDVRIAPVGGPPLEDRTGRRAGATDRDHVVEDPAVDRVGDAKRFDDDDAVERRVL